MCSSRFDELGGRDGSVTQNATCPSLRTAPAWAGRRATRLRSNDVTKGPERKPTATVRQYAVNNEPNRACRAGEDCTLGERVRAVFYTGFPDVAQTRPKSRERVRNRRLTVAFFTSLVEESIFFFFFERESFSLVQPESSRSRVQRRRVRSGWSKQSKNIDRVRIVCSRKII